MKDSNLQDKIEECFNKYSFEYVWLYMKNRDDITNLYPKLVNELYNIISSEKVKLSHNKM